MQHVAVRTCNNPKQHLNCLELWGFPIRFELIILTCLLSFKIVLRRIKDESKFLQIYFSQYFISVDEQLAQMVDQKIFRQIEYKSSYLVRQ